MPSKAILASGNPFVLALQDALGLPRETIAFDLHCEAGKAVTVRCTFMPQSDGVDGFDPRPLTREYLLVEASDAKAGSAAEPFKADEQTDGVKVVQHVNVEPRADAAIIALAMRQAKDNAMAEIKANLAQPVVPQPQPVRGPTTISAAALGWGIFGMLGAGAALSYALGLWP